MNDAPRQTLRELIARHGPGLCSDARRCEALLRDHAAAHRREVNTLVSALKERVPLDLLAAQSAMPRALLAARLAKRLEDHLALTPEAARWAVDSWALALGLVTEAEVREREERVRREATEGPTAPPSSTAPAPRPSFGADADEEDEEKRRAAQSQKAQTTQKAPPPQTPPPQTTRPASPPPRQRQQPPAQPPPPRATTPAPRTTPPPAVARPAARQSPPAPSPQTSWPPPSPWGRIWSPARRRPAGGALPEPTPDPPPKRGGGRTLRGCTVGCLLIVLLALALFVGGPFVLSVLREEQERRNLEPSPVLSP